MIRFIYLCEIYSEQVKKSRAKDIIKKFFETRIQSFDSINDDLHNLKAIFLKCKMTFKKTTNKMISCCWTLTWDRHECKTKGLLCACAMCSAGYGRERVRRLFVWRTNESHKDKDTDQQKNFTFFLLCHRQSVLFFVIRLLLKKGEELLIFDAHALRLQIKKCSAAAGVCSLFIVWWA
jgi:hypothetical protein